MKKFSSEVYTELKKIYIISVNGFDIAEEKFRASEINVGDNIYIFLTTYEVEKIEGNKIYVIKK